MKTLFIKEMGIIDKVIYGVKVARAYLSRNKNEEQKFQLPLPDVHKFIDVFCFHTGGRAVLEGMQNLFKLTEDQMAPSKASLFCYGNTSSASTWYELAYAEQVGVKKGSKIW